MTVPPTARRRQQALARVAKRAPGYRWALREVLPRVRRNPVLSDLAWRVFAPRHGAGHVDVPMHPGRYVGGPDVDLLPVVAFLATGLSEDDADALVEDVARHQQDLGSFRPLLVLDRPAFAAARRHGFVLEVLTPLAGWAGDEESWTAYVADRAASLVDHYQLWQLVRSTGPRLAAPDRALLAALGRRLPEDLRVTRTTGPSAG